MCIQPYASTHASILTNTHASTRIHTYTNARTVHALVCDCLVGRSAGCPTLAHIGPHLILPPQPHPHAILLDQAPGARAGGAPGVLARAAAAGVQPAAGASPPGMLGLEAGMGPHPGSAMRSSSSGGLAQGSMGSEGCQARGSMGSEGCLAQGSMGSEGCQAGGSVCQCGLRRHRIPVPPGSGLLGCSSCSSPTGCTCQRPSRASRISGPGDIHHPSKL